MLRFVWPSECASRVDMFFSLRLFSRSLIYYDSIVGKIAAFDGKTYSHVHNRDTIF